MEYANIIYIYIYIHCLPSPTLGQVHGDTAAMKGIYLLQWGGRFFFFFAAETIVELGNLSPSGGLRLGSTCGPGWPTSRSPMSCERMDFRKAGRAASFSDFQTSAMGFDTSNTLKQGASGNPNGSLLSMVPIENQTNIYLNSCGNPNR